MLLRQGRSRIPNRMVHLPAHSLVLLLGGSPDAQEGTLLCSVHKIVWRNKAKPLCADELKMYALEPLDAYLEPERDKNDIT